MFTVEDRNKITIISNALNALPYDPYTGGGGQPPPPQPPPQPPPNQPPPGGGGGNPPPPIVIPVVQPIDIDVDGILGQLVGVVNATVIPLINGVLASIASTVGSIRDSVVSGVSTALSGIGTALANAILPLKNALADAVNGIGQSIRDVVNNLKGVFTDLLADMRNAVTSAINAVHAAINGIKTTLIQVVSDLVAGIKQTIANVIDDVGTWIAGALYDIKDWIITAIANVKDWIAGVYGNIKDWLSQTLNTLKATYESTKKTVENLFSDLLAWLRDLRDKISAAFWEFANNMGKIINEKILPPLAKMTDWAQNLTGLSPDDLELIKSGDFSTLKTGIDRIFDAGTAAAIDSPLFSLATAIIEFGVAVQIQFVPAQVAAQKYAEIALGLTPADLSSMSHAVYKGLTDSGTFIENARIGGMTQERAELVLEAQRPLPTPGQVQAAFLRGEIDLDRHNTLLTSYGFTKEDIQVITSLYMLIPPPSDLIRMSVREAFSPEIAERFGQFEDYPEAFSKWAAKQGISEDWAKRYWAAHWDLPSPTMGFEMLHRGVIDNEELKLLLRALDVMPYWRERLIAISYNPLTRVDVRRMYKLGLLTDEQVKRSYLDLGYDDEKAGWLTEFTKRYSAPEDQSELDEFRSLARSTYSQAYRRKLISRDEYNQMLTAMKYYQDDVQLLISLDDYAMMDSDKLFDTDDYRKNYHKLTLAAYQEGLLNRVEITQILIDLEYTQDEAAMQIGLVDYEQQLTIRNLISDRVHEQYISFIIDNTQASTLLDVFQFTPDEIAKLFEAWNIERSLRTRKPSLTDLKRFYNQGLLSLDQFLDELRGEGYHERYIDLYRASLTL